jgi:hypothetical protein
MLAEFHQDVDRWLQDQHPLATVPAAYAAARGELGKLRC